MLIKPTQKMAVHDKEQNMNY